MSPTVMNALLDKLVAETLEPREREELMDQLHIIQSDSTRPATDRIAAILLRASLESRAAG